MFSKKLLPIPILVAAVACMATVSAAPASAMYQDERGNKWWSVEELLQYADEVDAEEEALCGDDMGCREELFFSKLDAHDQKYESLDMFRQSQFSVTSINPAAGKLDMIYFDQDPMLRRMGIDERDQLKYVYMAWALRGDTDIGNINPDLPLESQIDTSDAQVVYAGHDYEFGPGGFPSNQVFSLPVDSAKLAANTRGHLLANTYGYSFYNAATGINYASCLESPHYVSGESCDLMFSAENGSRYFPHNLATQTPTTTDVDQTAEGSNQGEPTQTPDPSQTSDPTQSPDSPSDGEPNPGQSANPTSVSESSSESGHHPNDPTVSAQVAVATGDARSTFQESDSLAKISDASTENSGSVDAKSANDASEPLAESVELPVTGSLQDKCEREVVFPWWLILLLLIGDAVILWLFWPKNRKKVEKNS